MQFVPVDHDPFAASQEQSAQPQFVPVDHDPFAGPQQQQSLIERAISPITSYPETYNRMRQEAQGQMAEGLEQVKAGFSFANTPTPEGVSRSSGLADILKGAGNMAMGGIGYTASPINAAVRSIAGKPVQDVTGIPAEYTDFAASLALPGFGMTRAPMLARAPKVKPPSKDELFSSAKEGYTEAREMGVKLDPAGVGALTDRIKSSLLDTGYRDIVAPKTFRAIEELRTPAGPSAEFADIESVRRLLNKVAADPAEKDAARIAISSIDNYLGSIPKGDVVAGPADQLSRIANEARGNYAAAKRAERVEKMTGAAELQAASSGSGANIDNALRQQAKSLLRSKQARGFSKDERDQLQKIVMGTFTGNAARYVGKLAPTGVVSMAMGGGPGAVIGGMVGGPVGAAVGGAAVMSLGYAGKKLSDVMTASQIGKLDSMIRSNSPLARSVKSSLEDWARAAEAAQNNPIPARIGTLMMQSRNLATNLKDAGITVSPSDLMRTFQGGRPGRADQENPEAEGIVNY